MGTVRKLLVSAGDLGRVIRAAGYSLSGLRAAIRKEAAFRQELILFVLLVPLGAWLGRDGIERALLIGVLFLVLIVELLNTGIETVVDRIGLERHELSGLAKDVGSTAVLLSFGVLVVIWGFLLLG